MGEHKIVLLRNHGIVVAGPNIEETCIRGVLLEHIDFDGNTLAGRRKRHNEFPIHSEVYRTNPDIMCVIHTHPTYSTIIASSDKSILPITNLSCAFYPPAIDKFEESSDLIVTPEQGISVAKLLANTRSCFCAITASSSPALTSRRPASAVCCSNIAPRPKSQRPPWACLPGPPTPTRY